MTQMDYKYSLLGSAVDDYRKRPLLLQVEDVPMNPFAVMEVKRELLRSWTTQSYFSKIRLYSFIVGLVVTFLIMTSYLLTGDKKGLFLTPSPYHYSSLVSPGPFAFNLSSVKDHAHLKLVVKSITSKLDFHRSRQIPDVKALVNSEPHMFSVIPHKFLPGVKNPCWYEEYTENITLDPYRANFYGRYTRRFRAVFLQLRITFREHLLHRNGKLYRMRCLPYFYIIGQPKCGTTDLYTRLSLHPDIFTTVKEPHWWTRKRFGIALSNERFRDQYPVESYLDLFDKVADQIQGKPMANASGRPSHPNIITGEASASTMWDNRAGNHCYDNTTEPPFLIQDFIHALQPDARFIVMLRDPVERLYSDYLYFGNANKSAEDFHVKVAESLQIFERCLTENTMHLCVYNYTVLNAMPVRLTIGLYIVYLMDWLTVFSKKQILVLRLEDHSSNMKYTMHKVFDFLNLGPVTKEKESEITWSPASNTRRQADKDLGPMLPITREILQDFHMPFNEKLAQVLQNDSFLWEDKL
ncbi:carbohydrate sulfotransferase 15 [Solea solea]|uniref:carbohydrate sulfotransferase 15 n=1 Tax=Solea solea TaxID=90069 RepID=UPI00272C4F11|nr:carbohydrate sulfotransferase 15 [Solea solea]XP_058477787.1 carbohydrate sulfotransferase 15 [Solea solea]